MDRRKSAWGQHRPLHAFLTTLLYERAEVREISELYFVNRRLRANGERLSYLRNYNADLPSGHLYPRMLRDCVHEGELEAETGHQHVRLVSRLPEKRERIVARELGSESLANQSDLRGADAVNRSQKDEETGGADSHDQEKRRRGVECHRSTLRATAGYGAVSSRILARTMFELGLLLVELVRIVGLGQQSIGIHPGSEVGDVDGQMFLQRVGYMNSICVTPRARIYGAGPPENPVDSVAIELIGFC